MRINIKSFRKLGLIAFGALLTIVFGIMGYYFRPIHECDVYQYRLYLSTYEGIAFNASFGKTFPFSYVFNIWFWLLAKVGDIYLLSASSCLLVYGIYIYIFTDYYMVHKKTLSSYISGLIFIIGNLSFMQIASSIRNFVALAISCLAMYLFSKNRIISVVLGISAVLVHSSIAILFILLVFYRCKNFNLHRKTIWKVLLITAGFAVCVFIIITKSNDRLIELTEKYAQYFTRESFASTLYYVVKKIYSYFLLLAGWVFIRHKGREIEASGQNVLEIFCFFVFIEIITFPFPDQIYSRFFQGAILFMAILLIYNNRVRDESGLKIAMTCSGLVGAVLDFYLLIHAVR